jgi:hypothetical protein
MPDSAGGGADGEVFRAIDVDATAGAGVVAVAIGGRCVTETTVTGGFVGKAAMDEFVASGAALACAWVLTFCCVAATTAA